MSKASEEYIAVKIPDYIRIQDTKYSVSDLMSKVPTTYKQYQKKEKGWTFMRTVAQFSGLKTHNFKIAEPCKEEDYKVTPTSEKRYMKWWHLVIKTKPEMQVLHPEIATDQIPLQRYQAKVKLQTDSNFSYWLHKNGLV